MNQLNVSITDQELLNKIHERIYLDIRVSNSDTFVTVSEGRVELSGYFDEAYRQEAVVSIITTIDGVKELINKSQVVRDYYRTDAELEALIAKQLTSCEFLPGEWIDVEVVHGVVTLEGQVYRARLKAFAARLGWEHSGVRDCLNRIVILQTGESVLTTQALPLRMLRRSPAASVSRSPELDPPISRAC